MKKTIDLTGKTGEQEIILDKEGMEYTVIGTFEAHGSEIIELNVKIIHKVPHTKAETTLRAVAWDKSQLKISGTIVIEKAAQQTNSFLRENILLMSPHARAEAIPNLEIEANDVKCSHAATITKISEEQVFYLMSRGISRKKAEKLIVEGFLKIV